MIVLYGHIQGIPGFPAKDDPPLVIDADRVKIASIAGQFFKPVTGRNPEVSQIIGIMQIKKLPPGRAPQFRWELSGVFRTPVLEEVFREAVAEIQDHVVRLS